MPRERVVPSEPPEAIDASFPKAARVRRRPDYLRVQKQGRRVHTTHYLVALYPREGSPDRRFGVTVTKKVSKAAVGRNRVKRVLREVVRRNPHLFPPGVDVVIIAKSGAPLVGYHDALAELSGVQAQMTKALSSSRPRSGRRRRTRGRSTGPRR